jgi:hypothetical protein
MRHTVGGVVFAAVSALTCAPALAQSWTVPPESHRCPSKWGAGDERGSGNHMKPASVLRATQLIKTGEVIEIAHVMNDKMPFFGTRRFDVHVKRTFMNDFSNRRGSNEEIVISEIGQVGTQSTASPTRPTRTATTTVSRPAPSPRGAALPSSASRRSGC